MNYELSSHQKFLRKLKKDFDLHIRKNWKEEYISQTVSDYEKNILVFLNEYLYAKEKKLPPFLKYT